MVAAHDPDSGVGCQRLARKHPKPRQLSPRVRVFAVQRVRHPHTGEARFPVRSIERFREPQLCSKLFPSHFRQQRRPVPVPLPAANEHQTLIELELLHAQLATFRNAQSSSVDKRRHQPRIVQIDELWDSMDALGGE